MRRLTPDPNCEDCGGTGKTYIPAHQSGGDIVDEQEQDCICTIPDETEDDEDYGGGIGTRPWEPKDPPNDDSGNGAVPSPVELEDEVIAH